MNEKEINGFLYGGDYNPEQWLHMPEILEQDISYLKQAHCNEVTLGVFAWAALEPEEGRYEFDWLEQIISRMHQEGISVILATPSGARPKWLADQYPEVLRVDETGVRNYFGKRHNHCYSSPVYREKVKRINHQLAVRFGNHPAVKYWHISNEYGGACYCSLCQERFRTWLKEKYGTIENLNRRWCTAFWSHTYQNFDQIEAPSSRGESALHGLTLEWKRFVTWATRDFMEMEIQALREAGSRIPATTNMMYAYEGLDYRELAKSVDIISWDAYPAWHKEEEWKTAVEWGRQHDLFRSMKKQPFLLMESSPSSTNWQPVSKLRKPGMAKAAALQAVAHGSDSVQYFQIRQSRGASEKFHGAVIDHYGGTDTRVFGEVTEIGEVLEQLAECAGSICESRVAVFYDWNNRWAVCDAQGPRNIGIGYEECVSKVYGGFRSHGLDVDLVGPEDRFSDYRILAVPMGYLMSEGVSRKIREFVAGGGTLLMTYWSGVVDEQDRCYLGKTPHDLTEVLGLRFMEIDGLYDWEENTFVDQQTGEVRFSCHKLCELVKLEGAEALMVYGKDFYAGMPAFTVNFYGNGRAYYVCADAEPDFYKEISGKIAKECGLGADVLEMYPDGIPRGLEITRRQKENVQYLFVQNFGKKAVASDWRRRGFELLYGEEGWIGPLETQVYKKNQKNRY